MYKILFFVTLYCFTTLLSAEEKAAEVQPLDPKYMGTHGMVLVTHASSLYASVLPQYKPGQNVQLIYRVDSKYIPLLHLVNDADLVTVKPKPFNLQSLIRGEKLSLKADVYIGHFARGGSLTLPNIDLVMDTQLYLRMLGEPQPSSSTQVYDSVELNNNRRLLVHQIQSAPSYDHLLLLLDDVSCITTFRASSAVPSQNEIYQKLAFCGSIKPLYYETDEFQK